MRKFYILLMLVSILPSMGARADQKIKWQYSYGDNMGEVDSSTVSKKVEYLYDKDGRLSRTIQNSLLHDGSDSFVLTNLGRYTYGESNKLSAFDSYNYTADRLGVYHFSESTDYVSYIYDSAGKLYKEVAAGYYYVYDYDDQGRTIKRETWKNTNEGWVLNTTETYSDFNSFNEPLKVSCYSDRASYNCWDGKYTYDEQGNKISYLVYTTEGTLKSAEYWMYDGNGRKTEYQKKAISNGAESDGSKIEYTYEGSNKMSQRSYSYSYGSWHFIGGSKKEEYYDEVSACAAPTVSAVQDATGTGITMTVTPAESGKRYKYLCNGLHEVTTSDLTYHISSLEIGPYDFFVQDVESGVISNVVSLDVEVDLPRPSNLKAVSAQSITTKGETTYTVDITWTAPQNTQGLTLTGYNVKRVTSYGSCTLNEEPFEPTATSATVSFGIDSQYYIFLEAVYAEGTSKSDTIWADALELIGKDSTGKLKLTRVDLYNATDDNLELQGYYFYGQKDRIDRYTIYLASSDKWTLYTTYDYNNLSQLVSEKNELGTTTYEYNSYNQLVKEVNGSSTTEYEYDTDGNNVKKTVTSDSGTSIFTYSDFQAKDKPRLEMQTITTTSTSYYRVVHVYDSDDRQTCDSTFQSQDGSAYSLLSVTSHELMTGGSFREKIYTQRWNSSTQQLDDYTTYYIYNYNEIDAAKYAATLSVTSDGQTATLKVKIVGGDAMTRVNMFEDGEEIAHAVEYMGDDYDWGDEKLILSYPVNSESHEFFVQYAKADNTLTNLAQENNISNIVTVGTASGIVSVNSGQSVADKYNFNLAGQKVNGNSKGIIIINGKKIVR